MDAINLKVLILLAMGFSLASIFGYLAHFFKVSPILGFLLAGYLIGPYSPGLVADVQMTEQLAEVGIVLMLFSIGLNFKIKNLFRVKTIALVGGIGQVVITTAIAILILHFFNFNFLDSLIIGFAIGVASTVVLVRMLEEHTLLNTEEGHIAIGWLIVEDILTVIMLMLLPTLGALKEGPTWDHGAFLKSVLLALGKFFLLAFLLLRWGHRLITFILRKVIRRGSHELFTLATLALIFVLALGSTYLFNISIALGSFIAGLVVGRTEMKDLVILHSAALKDAFIALFFLSVGMLFNPCVIYTEMLLFITILLLILLLKPAIAYLLARCFRHRVKTSLIIAISLAQIGEFSFILAEEAIKWKLFTEKSYAIIVACALLSIAINSLMFKKVCTKYA